MQVRKLTISIIIFLVLIVGVFGVTYFIQRTPLAENNEPVSQEIDTSEWKTYNTKNSSLKVINGKESFEFKYPPNWFLEEGGINNIGHISVSSYNNEKVARMPQNYGEVLISFEVGYDKLDDNFINGMSIIDWCGEDLIPASIYMSRYSQESLTILEKGNMVIDNSDNPFIIYSINNEKTTSKNLCFRNNDKINIIQIDFAGSVNNEIINKILESINTAKYF